MRTSFYPKIALNSIKLNKKLYIPYILTSALWIMMFYIIFSMSTSEQVTNSSGGASISMILNMGVPFIFLFSILFLFYTNSFLSKMRNKEYALYNILGMNRKNIAQILCWDTLITAAISLTLGLISGILFYKLFELLLLRITQDDVNFAFSIDSQIIIYTSISFIAIFGLILIKSLLKIRLTSPIELLKSQKSGEKPPKANFLLGIAGLACLACAYYISLTANNPMAAIPQFFIAVMLVVAGTYLLFVVGSVLLCKILQNNKSYYYKPGHFISVSSMAYRMKRTGAGLAAICIFSTMVLVMLSSTFSLYIGNEDLLEKRYPMDINMLFASNDGQGMPDEFINDVANFAKNETEKHGGTIEEKLVYTRLATSGQLQGDSFELDYANATSFDALYQIFFFDVEDYNNNTGSDITLGAGEVYVHSPREEFEMDTVTFLDSSFIVKGILEEFWSDGVSAMTIFPPIMLVVDDLGSIQSLFDGAVGQNGSPLISSQFSYNFNIDLPAEQQPTLSDSLSDSFVTTLGHYTHLNTFSVESLEGNRLGFYGLFGGLLFIGLVLSILFISATVLIIYYKQIVEGYEDRPRFEIMQKIGMTNGEIKKSINSQILTVFFLPLIMAGIHLSFAFPIIRLFLLMFNLTNISLFIAVSIIGFLAFALLYTVVYKVTSKFYYDIVSTNG